VRDSAANAATKIFDYWKENHPSSKKNKEHDQILRCLADFIHAHANSRFLDINWKIDNETDDNDSRTDKETVAKKQVRYKNPLVREQVGYFDDSSGASRIYLFTAGGLREATKGFDFKRVLQALEEADAFAKVGATQKTVTTRVPEGGTKALYHIDPAKLTVL
jgi:putative DNA primase/helicase